MNWKTIYRHSFSLQNPPSRFFIFATRKLWNYLVQVFLVGFSSFLLSHYTSLLSDNASHHLQNQSIPNPLRCYENRAEKDLFQWKQKTYPIWELEQSNSDPVWWKHCKNGNILRSTKSRLHQGYLKVIVK